MELGRDVQRVARYFSWFYDLVVYSEGLKKRFQILKLELFESGTNVPIKLPSIFIEQNVRDCQLFQPRIHEHRKHYKAAGTREAQEEQLDALRSAYYRQAPRPVLEVLQDAGSRLFVILGDPGSGKSVLLPVSRASVGPESFRFPSFQKSLCPLFVELKTFIQAFRQGHCHDFLSYVDHGPGAVGHLDKESVHRALEHGDAFMELMEAR